MDEFNVNPSESGGGSPSGGGGGGSPFGISYSKSYTPVFDQDLYDTAAAPTFPAINAPAPFSTPALGQLGTPATFTPNNAGAGVASSNIPTGPVVGLQSIPVASPMSTAMQALAPAYAPSTVASTGTQAQLMPTPQGVQQVQASPLGAPGQAQMTPQGQAPMLYGGASVGASGQGGGMGYIGGAMQGGAPGMSPQALLGAPQENQQSANTPNIPINGEGQAPQQGQGQPQTPMGNPAYQQPVPRQPGINAPMNSAQMAQRARQNAANPTQLTGDQFAQKIANDAEAAAQAVRDRYTPQFTDIADEIANAKRGVLNAQAQVERVQDVLKDALDPLDQARAVDRIESALYSPTFQQTKQFLQTHHDKNIQMFMSQNPDDQQIQEFINANSNSPLLNKHLQSNPNNKTPFLFRMLHAAESPNFSEMATRMMPSMENRRYAAGLELTAIGHAFEQAPGADKALHDAQTNLSNLFGKGTSLAKTQANEIAQAKTASINGNLSQLAAQRMIDNEQKNQFDHDYKEEKNRIADNAQKEKVSQDGIMARIHQQKADSMAQNANTMGRLASVAEEKLPLMAAHLQLNREAFEAINKARRAKGALDTAQEDRLRVDTNAKNASTNAYKPLPPVNPYETITPPTAAEQAEINRLINRKGEPKHPSKFVVPPNAVPVNRQPQMNNNTVMAQPANPVQQSNYMIPYLPTPSLMQEGNEFNYGL